MNLMITIIIGVITFIIGTFTGMVLTSFVVVAGRDKRENE